MLSLVVWLTGLCDAVILPVDRLIVLHHRGELVRARHTPMLPFMWMGQG
jgi:hypothetical protein